MDVPIKITPCPIIDCSIELRFRSSVESGAVFGIVYNTFRSQYPQVEKLPILNIPEEIRLADKNLTHQPWYRLKDKDYVLTINPRTLALGKIGEYPGWSVISERLRAMIGRIGQLGIVDAIERIGLRYINFFDFNIFDRTNLSISIKDMPLADNPTLLRTTVPTGRFNSMLYVANMTQVLVKGAKEIGSVIDIDTNIEINTTLPLDQAISTIEEGHIEEKRVFFRLLAPDFLKTLNPEY